MNSVVNSDEQCYLSQKQKTREKKEKKKKRKRKNALWIQTLREYLLYCGKKQYVQLESPDTIGLS